MYMAKSKIPITVFLFMVGFSQIVYSQQFEDGFYRLTSKWQGGGKSLDVVNDGENNQIHLAATSNVSGQYWKFSAVGGGFYRLSTKWLGENKSLEVVTKDGIIYKLLLQPTDDVDGQLWKITPLGDGFYRITNKLFGGVKSLDVVNNGNNDNILMRNTGNFSGQSWKITNDPSGSKEDLTKIKEFKKVIFSGFNVFVNPRIEKNQDTIIALQILAEKLQHISHILKPHHLKKLRTVSIWIEYKYIPSGAMWYHTSKEWLMSNGYPAELENSIEISNVKNFADWQEEQPYMVLHELAHAYSDLFLEDLQSRIVSAYHAALQSGKYDDVSHIKGNRAKAYAMNNPTEYFAELTEAFFGQNDYYPFNKKQLQEFDPIGYRLMEIAWK